MYFSFLANFKCTTTYFYNQSPTSRLARRPAALIFNVSMSHWAATSSTTPVDDCNCYETNYIVPIINIMTTKQNRMCGNTRNILHRNYVLMFYLKNETQLQTTSTAFDLTAGCPKTGIKYNYSNILSRPRELISHHYPDAASQGNCQLSAMKYRFLSTNSRHRKQ